MKKKWNSGGHLPLVKFGNFVKNVFYSLRADGWLYDVLIQKKPVSLGDGDKMQVPHRTKKVYW